MSLRQKGKGKRSNLETNGHHDTNHDEKRLKNGHQNGKDFTYEFSETLKLQREQFKQCWTSGDSSATLTDIEFISEPFQCGVLQNVVANSSALFNDLLVELQDVETSDKNNDLYKFKQSSRDLKYSQSPHISALKNLLETEVRQWLEDVTGIPLNKDIDLFCAQYRYTDHLLCHDDELEGRRIAFIMYFVKDWSLKDGGTLDLFDRDSNGDPRSVVKRLVPKTNALAFFEVTEKSWHQVAEVLSKDKQRLSIGGWFHGQPYARPEKPLKSNNDQDTLEPVDIDEDEFYAWINPTYLDPEIQAEVSAKFEETSEISLPDFLNEDKFKLVSDALRQTSNWKRKGPANQRCYDIVDYEQANQTIQDCVRFLRSDATFLMLSNMTGLRLHPLAPENDEDDENNSDDNDAGPSTSSNTSEKPAKKTSDEIDPKCKIEVRRWRHASYTLLNDTNVNNDKYYLDGRLFFNCQGWNLEQGGFTSYIAKDEDEELLTATPEMNTLQLIYKDAQTLGFVKYVNEDINTLPNGEFHDMSVTYFE